MAKAAFLFGHLVTVADSRTTATVTDMPFLCTLLPSTVHLKMATFLGIQSRVHPRWRQLTGIGISKVVFLVALVASIS